MGTLSKSFTLLNEGKRGHRVLIASQQNPHLAYNNSCILHSTHKKKCTKRLTSFPYPEKFAKCPNEFFKRGQIIFAVRTFIAQCASSAIFGQNSKSNYKINSWILQPIKVSTGGQKKVLCNNPVYDLLCCVLGPRSLNTVVRLHNGPFFKNIFQPCNPFFVKILIQLTANL